MCLFESVPPKQKQTIDLPERRRAPALRLSLRGCCAGTGRAGPGWAGMFRAAARSQRTSAFPPEPSARRGRNAPLALNPGLISPLKEASEPARARKVLPGLLSLNYNFINISCSRPAAPPRSRSRPCLRAGRRRQSAQLSARYHPYCYSYYSDDNFYCVRRVCSSRRIPDPSLALGSAPGPRC